MDDIAMMREALALAQAAADDGEVPVGCVLVRGGELTSWDLRMVISTLAQSTGNHIFIADTDGTIVSCSCRNIACEPLGRSVGSAQLPQLRSDGKFNLITNLGGFYASPHYVVAQPITIGTDARVIGYVFVHLGKFMDFVKKGIDPKEALEKAKGCYGRFAEAKKYIDPRHE